MPRGFPIGRLFRTDIEATPGFLVLLGLYFFLNRDAPVARTAVFCLAVVVSLLVHEFGHVLAVRRLLRAPSRVLLWGLGGLCIHEPSPSPGKQIGISLMGPAFSLALGLLALAPLLLLGGAGHPLASYLVWVLVWINFVWTAANLLPIFPLDGGQALRATLHALRVRAAPGIAHRVSVVTAALATAAAFSYGFRFAGVLAALLLMDNLLRPPPGA